MKVLLDQGLPRSAAEHLRQANIDALHTGEVNLAETPDEEIIEYGRQTERVIITLDADFHALLAVSGAQYPSVIRIRIEGLQATPLADIVKKLLLDFETELENGALLSVQERQVRVRRLPIEMRSE